MFKTPERQGRGFSLIVAQNGGQENAFTSQDIQYHQTFAADRLDTMMRIEAERGESI